MSGIVSSYCFSFFCLCSLIVLLKVCRDDVHSPFCSLLSWALCSARKKKYNLLPGWLLTPFTYHSFILWKSTTSILLNYTCITNSSNWFWAKQNHLFWEGHRYLDDFFSKPSWWCFQSRENNNSSKSSFCLKIFPSAAKINRKGIFFNLIFATELKNVANLILRV